MSVFAFRQGKYMIEWIRIENVQCREKFCCEFLAPVVRDLEDLI